MCYTVRELFYCNAMLPEQGAMARTTPIVQVDVLIYQRDGEECSLAVGTPAWYAWLETVTTFAFSSSYGTFTARKEQAGNRRGG